MPALEGIQGLDNNAGSVENSDKVLAMLFSKAHDPMDYLEIVSL